MPDAPPAAWIFQANTDKFDIEGFLATQPETFLWLASQSASRMAPGATVYIWRSISGGPRDEAGIIAQAEIVDGPSARPEDDTAREFWRVGDPSASAPRVRLRTIRVATSKQRLKYDWLKKDPILADLNIFKQPVQTNFFLSDDHARRLSLMWERTGEDWTYAEAVAGLWAYDQTRDIPVSMLPGSTVSRVSILTGRTVSGVYNKVMNFRALDPEDSRAGLAATSDIDKGVWAKFFDPALGLAREELVAEFDRLWTPNATSASRLTTPRVDAADVAETLLGRSLADLLARYAKKAKGRAESNIRPRARQSVTTEFDRDALVVAIARLRAGDACEVEGCSHPTFLKKSGEVYVEVHHIEPLERGGADTPNNVACVCPAHHREAHLGANAKKIAAGLQALRASEAT